jgi:hypothetical protein
MASPRSRAGELRVRAGRLREQAERFVERARSLGPGSMADMLVGEAAILADAANALETQALELMTPVGTA